MMTMKGLRDNFYRLLRFSEQYTRTDMVYLFRGGTLLFIGQAIASIAAFAVTTVLAHYLPKEVFGQYRFVLSVVPILAIFSLPGMATAITQSVARGHSGNLRSVLKTKILWGLIGSLLSLILFGYYALVRDNVVLGFAFLISSIFVPIYTSFFIYNFYLQGTKQFRQSVTYTSSARVISAVILLLTLLVSKNILVILCMHFVTTIGPHVIWYFHTLTLVPPNTTDDPELIHYGKHLSFMGAVGVLITHLDKLFIWHFLGSIPLSLYLIAAAVPLEGGRILNVINSLALPKFSSNFENHQNIGPQRNILLRKIAGLMFIMFCIASCYVIIAPWFFEWFFPTYTEVIVYSQILIFTIVFRPLAVINMFFNSIKNTRAIHTLSFTNLILKLSALAICIPLWGFDGIIVGVFAYFILYSLFRVLYFVQYTMKHDSTRTSG